MSRGEPIALHDMDGIGGTMKATDFNLEKDLKLDIENGIASFQNNRLVILDANALGLLRRTLINEISKERARDVLLKYGYSNGYSDFIQMKKRYTFENETELLASGPVIHTWEGIVKAVPTEIRFDRATKEFYFTGTWTNSWEAEQHLCFFDEDTEPVCYTLMGYSSGWCSAFFGSPLISIEPKCVGKGDDTCGWCIQPPSSWGDEAKPYIDAMKPLFKV